MTRRIKSGLLEGYLLGDEASKRKAKQVNLRQAECVDEGNDMLCHA